MSLHWRILGALIFVIVLTILISIGVAYWTSQTELAELTTDITRDEANALARELSHEYTRSGSWEMVAELQLEEGPFDYEELTSEELAQLAIEESFIEELTLEEFAIESMRFVVVDVDGCILYDTDLDFEEGECPVDLPQQRSAVVDFRTGAEVGYVYADPYTDFWIAESEAFLARMLSSSALGGLLTALITVVIAAWLSRRITAPVTALTKATQAIVTTGNATQLPVATSDELGQMSTAFNQMAADLATQRTLRKRLVDDIAHELNTPLSVIQLEATGLNDGTNHPRGGDAAHAGLRLELAGRS